ncbi:hypothetical protein MIND_00179200 [Mycena indigotica]|uniref:Uncharacterized protein n=1 Tax=Mycena indigotica TaxID=2126181 RepID=A0A8H6WGP9_9AGAR|nr:uncharacterized protein MIND_00179200 [Mycena indigotica]KAF7311694.1 hypothetical protein MIND_00179200 [Mycena indigotica]
MRSTFAFVIGAALLPFAVLSAPTTTVIVPGGPKLAEDVHLVPTGGSLAHVDNFVHILHANGTVLKQVPVGATPGPTPVRVAERALKTGWITYASWLNQGASPIKHFTTTWTVPPVPKTQNGQTIFLFNSIEPSSFDAIIQPVLQYGPSAAGGGAFWAVASWYLVGSNVFHTTPIRVSAGMALNGVITLTGISGTNYNYATRFTNVDNTILNVKNAAQLTWATETLEAYALKAASDYPAGSTVFSAINLTLQNGNAPSVKWATANDAADGLSTTVNTDGATNAKITIKY